MAQNELLYRGETYTKLKSGNCYLVTSLPFSELEANTLKVTIESNDTSLLDFQRGEPLIYRHNGGQVGIFYVQDVQRIAPNQYTFTATSAIGILSEGKHYGGIYTGSFVSDVVADLCGTVPYAIKHSLQGVKLFGWLPIASPRENLAQVLFAIGATVTTDLDGILRIEGIWDGISGVTGANKLCMGAKVTYDASITQVTITEHQYIAVSDDEIQLFEGTVEEGDIITFHQPMFNLIAVGFTILESNANFAKVSAGSGTLTGSAYTHNTRTVLRSVTTSSRPNIKTVENATLVSLTNSTAVAERMADFYKCIQTIEAPTIYQGERPGDCRHIFHPYDKSMVEGCVKSIDINISGKLKAQEKSLVGFVPPQSGDVEYFDFREVIDTDSTWTVPEGVTVLRVVLIGGGQGGWSGCAGGDAPSQTIGSDTSEVTNARTTYAFAAPTPAGEGGVSGDAGIGGSVWQSILDVVAGESFSIQIGQGGTGGEAGYESLEGAPGSPTIFGIHSSDAGGILPAGFLEEFSGELLACTGGLGYSGGRGDGSLVTSPTNWEDAPGETLVIDGISYAPGSTGPAHTDEGGRYDQDYGSLSARSAGGYGGGPAYGTPGNNGGGGYATCYTSSCSSKGGTGGAGGNALPPPQETVYGKGGTGGNGGGGAGGTGSAVSSCRVQKRWNSSTGSYVVTVTPGTPRAYIATPAKGGKGSSGGVGGNGCVIVYYRKPKPVKSGAVQDAQGQFVLDRLGRICVV